MTESKQYPGYYEIPRYSNYVVSKEGRVISRHSNSEITGSPNPAGYHNFRLTGDDGHCLTWGRHRLLAYVFIETDEHISDLMVNHKNGIKGNDPLSNLEWVTSQGNIEHAGENGLTTKCIPIEVRCVDTGVVLRYPSYRSCGLDLGLSKDAVKWRVEAGEDRVYPDRKQYRRAKNEPWIIPEYLDKAIDSFGFNNSVITRDVFTKVERVFESQAKLARYLNIANPTLTQWLDKSDTPVFPGFIQMKRGDDTSPWTDHSDPYLSLTLNTGTKPVVVINDSTGETKTFDSSRSCATEMFIKPTALHHRLKSDGKKVFSDGFRYCYYVSYIQNSPTT